MNSVELQEPPSAARAAVERVVLHGVRLLPYAVELEPVAEQAAWAPVAAVVVSLVVSLASVATAPAALDQVPNGDS
jgi:hypothetical protein